METLATLAAETGIDAAQAKALLESEAGIQEVKDLEQQVSAQGIHSVPTIRIGRELLSGAQSVEVFLAALQKGLNELATA